MSQPPSLSESGLPPCHGTAVAALRPACASWMPATAPCCSTKRATRDSGSTCNSCQIPRSPGEMRPRAVIEVASAITSAAPPTAREPRCTKCQSSAKPSVELYWHIGETPMRLRKVTPRMVRGSKSCGMARRLYRRETVPPAGRHYFSKTTETIVVSGPPSAPYSWANDGSQSGDSEMRYLVLIGHDEKGGLKMSEEQHRE